MHTEAWRGMLGSETLPALLFFFIIFFIPESPKWLIVKGKLDKASLVLSKIYATEEEVKEETKEEVKEAPKPLSDLDKSLNDVSRSSGLNLKTYFIEDNKKEIEALKRKLEQMRLKQEEAQKSEKAEQKKELELENVNLRKTFKGSELEFITVTHPMYEDRESGG